MEKRIAAIVVTYNRKKLLRENIEALLRQKNVVPDVLIIDNNSQDGTDEMVLGYIDLYDNLRYYNTGENLGGAGGFQYGIRLAVQLGYEYLWIMDDDCIPKETALSQLLIADAELTDDYGFLSSKVLWKDGNICRMNVQRQTLTRNMKDFDCERLQIAMASFVSLFLKADVVKIVGLPIKEFFIWTDDWEFTRRISRQYKCYFVGGSEVIHKSTSNICSDVSVDLEERLPRYQYKYRNDVYLYRREGIRGLLYEVVRLTAHVFRVLVKAKNHRWKRIKAIIVGTWNGLWFDPSIEWVDNKEV